jgi:MFS family permease
LAGEITLELEGKADKSASVLLVTIWELGEAAGPLLIAPLSEVYGRYPVYVTANALFVLCIIISAVSQSTRVLILTRFLNGAVVASNVLNPSIIGDMLLPEERGKAMSTVWMAPLIGGAVGPAVAGAIAETMGWRMVLWLAALIAGICEIAFLTMFRETYRPRILLRRASLVRQNSVGEIIVCAIDQDQTGEATVWESIKRPARVFFGSFVLQLLALYGAFEFTAFYVLGTSLPDILKDVYDMSTAQTGASYLCFSKSHFIFCSILTSQVLALALAFVSAICR